MEENNVNLRFLATNKCNYKCVFCHGDGVMFNDDIADDLVPEDFMFVYSVFHNLFGGQDVTISGGNIIYI